MSRNLVGKNGANIYSAIINGSAFTNNPATANPFQFALPWWVPPSTTRFRVKAASRETLSGAGGAAITGVFFAIGPSNGAGGFASPPVQVGPVTIPAGGKLFVGPWMTTAPGADGKVLVSYFLPSGSEIFYNFQVVGFATYNATTATSAYPLDPTLAASPAFNVISIFLDVDNPGAHYTVIGDSISVGMGSSDLKNCTYQLLQTTDGIPCATAGIGGAMLFDYLQSAETWFVDYMNVTGSKIIIEAGINDLGVRTLSQLKDDFGNLCAYLRSKGATRIVAQTTTPSTLKHAFDADRVAYNTWKQTLPAGIAACADVAAAVQDPGDHSLLNPAYDSGDGVHPNDAGYLAMLPVVAAAL